MKTVVCFGDSNTWGYDPLTRERFDRDTRWPGVLRKELGEGYLVLEEGLNGRTTVWDDPPPTTKLTRFSEMFEGAGEKSRRFGARFQAQAEEIGCPLLNAADEVVTSDLDGIHLEADQHRRLGKAVALRVRELLE